MLMNEIVTRRIVNDYDTIALWMDVRPVPPGGEARLQTDLIRSWDADDDSAMLQAGNPNLFRERKMINVRNLDEHQFHVAMKKLIKETLDLARLNDNKKAIMMTNNFLIQCQDVREDALRAMLVWKITPEMDMVRMILMLIVKRQPDE